MGEEKHALIELRKDDCQTDLDADYAQLKTVRKRIDADHCDDVLGTDHVEMIFSAICHWSL